MPEHFSFRWGIPILDNLDHVTIYHFLLDHYADLGVTPLEMMFIIHLSQFRYESSKGKAAPALGTIARLMGYKDEQPVRRLKKSLKDKKLLAVKDEPGRPNTYDFTAFAKKAFTLWQAEHLQSSGSEHGDTTEQTDDTPIQRDTGIQRDRGIRSTPIQLDTPPLSNQIGEEIEENKNHESPPPTNPQSAGGGGGGEYDRDIANLFRDYHIGQYRKLAKLYRAEYPNVTIDQLRLACESRFDRTIPATIAGGRLYLALQDGLPADLPRAAARALIPEPTHVPMPADVLPPHEGAALVLRLKAEQDKKKREAAHAA